jgi:hypothetical protein
MNARADAEQFEECLQGCGRSRPNGLAAGAVYKQPRLKSRFQQTIDTIEFG